MSVTDDVRYCIWRMDLWGRDYGSYDQIDKDVSRGVLVPGTMPRRYAKPDDKWPLQPRLVRRGWPAWRRRLHAWRLSLTCLVRGHVPDRWDDYWTPPDPCCQRCGKDIGTEGEK